jgi:hypothetical protein
MKKFAHTSKQKDELDVLILKMVDCILYLPDAVQLRVLRKLGELGNAREAGKISHVQLKKALSVKKLLSKAEVEFAHVVTGSGYAGDDKFRA